METWTSGEFGTTNIYVKYRIIITENSTNVVSNTSNVTVQVRFYRTNVGYTTYGTGTVYCSIDGTPYSAGVSPNDTITNSGIVLFSKTLNVEHDSNGSKRLSVSSSISHDVITSSTNTFDCNLSVIPRASELVVFNGTLGAVQSIIANVKSTSFTHTVTWTSGTYSGTIATKSSGAIWSFTPPLDLANGFPNGTDVYCTFTLDTYNGSTKIGTVRKPVYLKIPDSVKPSCSLTLSDKKGYLATYGGYIQGQSVLHCVVNPTLAYGSAISSYVTNVNGAKYTIQAFDAYGLTASGTNTITATVTDSRGRKGTCSSNVNVIPYQKPSVQSLTVRRCNEDGTENDKGSFAKIVFRYSITSLSGQNTKQATLYYKKSNESAYTEITLNAEYTVVDQTSIIPADDGSSYNIKLVVVDSFSSETVSTNLSTGYCLYHIPASGKGITFGAIAESDGYVFGQGAKIGELNVLENGSHHIRSMGPRTVEERATGFVNFADIVINGTYVSQPFSISVARRGDARITKLNIAFSGSSTTNPTLAAFTYEGVSNAFWITGSDGVYHLWAAKTEAWDYIDVIDCSIGKYMISDNKINIYWTNVFSSVTPVGILAVPAQLRSPANILWQGANWMGETTSLILPQNIMDQLTGVVFHWEAYDQTKGIKLNYDHCYHFVPKSHIVSHNTAGVDMTLANMGGNLVTHKYLYVANNRITGHVQNIDQTTHVAAGITWTRNHWVLSEVLGV